MTASTPHSRGAKRVSPESAEAPTTKRPKSDVSGLEEAEQASRGPDELSSTANSPAKPTKSAAHRTSSDAHEYKGPTQNALIATRDLLTATETIFSNARVMSEASENIFAASFEVVRAAQILADEMEPFNGPNAEQTSVHSPHTIEVADRPDSAGVSESREEYFDEELFCELEGIKPPHYPNPPVMAATAADKRNWEGFCEIESEPAYLNVMLHEFGVKGVRVQEVFSLEDEDMANFPLTHGLIFLSQYRQSDSNGQNGPSPEHVWFANQVVENACCIIAILNVLNNIPEIELGEHLKSFKEFTKDFSPLLRGTAINDWKFLKTINNSFARKSDMLKADLDMKEKTDNWTKKEVYKAALEAAKAAAVAAGKANPKSRTKPNSKPKDTNGSLANSYVDMSSRTYHYVGYVPIQGELWRLDGMDKNPVYIGPILGNNWLHAVIPILKARMNDCVGADIDYNLLALVKNPLTAKTEELASNIHTLQLLEERLDEVSPEWRLVFIPDATDSLNLEAPLMEASEMFHVTSEMIENAAISPRRLHTIVEDDDPNTLADLRERLLVQQNELRAEIMMEESLDASAFRNDYEKAEERRNEYSDYIHEHLKALAENGVLEEIIKDIEEEKKNGRR